MKTHALTGLAPTEEEFLEALQEQIPVRPYQLYERRRREDGRDLDDWLEAESEEQQRQSQ